MEAVPHPHGTIEWVDLSTPDVDAARSFYSTVFGWTYETSESPMGTYHVASAGGHQAAGLMASEPAVPEAPAWRVYVQVDSIGETITAIGTAAGSVLVAPFEIPGGAQVAVVADPVGAVFALISGGPAPEPGEPTLRRPEPGAVAWCELVSRDSHAAVSFYDAVFGWQAVRDHTTGYTVFRLNETDIGGLLPMPAEVPREAPSYWSVYFNAEDISAAVDAVAAAGGSIVKPATATAGVTFAVAADPAGAMFGILALPQPTITAA